MSIRHQGPTPLACFLPPALSFPPQNAPCLIPPCHQSTGAWRSSPSYWHTCCAPCHLGQQPGSAWHWRFFMHCHNEPCAAGMLGSGRQWSLSLSYNIRTNKMCWNLTKLTLCRWSDQRICVQDSWIVAPFHFCGCSRFYVFNASFLNNCSSFLIVRLDCNCTE